jgi:hypothetical protein
MGAAISAFSIPFLLLSRRQNAAADTVEPTAEQSSKKAEPAPTA